MCMYGCVYVYLYVVKYSFGILAVVRCGHVRERIRDMRKHGEHKMHEAHSMHAAVERPFTNTEYK